MTDSLQAVAAAPLEGDACSESSRGSTHSSCPSPAATGNGTGVFIPACILDGSAMSNPAIAAKFPRRQRRGSAPLCNAGPSASEMAKQHPDNSSPTSRSDSAAAPAAAPGPDRTSLDRHHSSRSSKHHGAAGSHSTSAKNPFAATPKNIRQQQLLCNLMAAADSFQDPHPAAGPSAGSRGASLDYGHMPPPAPGTTAGRPSLDVTSMSRAGSRTSLDSYGWGYMNKARSSCEMSGRPSMDSYAGTSIRSSMDRNSCWSGRPSVDSSFSCYGPAMANSQLLAQQQQQQAAATAAAAAAAAAAATVAARASFEAALPPAPAGAAGLNRMGMWHAGRGSCDLGTALASSGAASAFTRYSLDAATSDCHAAAAAAAAASALQLEHQRSMGSLLRYDSSAMSNVSSSSHESAVATNSNSCTQSAAMPADLAAAAANMAARRTQMAQLQQIIDSMAGINGAPGGISADTAAALATLTAQGVSPDTAALLLLQAQAAAAPSQQAGSNNGGVSPEAVMFQQQLQQIMQANQMAAAAAQTAAASQLYAASSCPAPNQQQGQRLGAQRWQSLGLDASETDLLREQGAPVGPAVNAANLQQQLEMLQHMQL